ncbi:MAG: hypothetical protein ACRD21_17760, partial [Vicinamibacteria bacterium]
MVLVNRHAILAALFLLASSRGSAEDGNLKGFLEDEKKAALEWEEKFRAIPNPENLREHMRVITE